MQTYDTTAQPQLARSKSRDLTFQDCDPVKDPFTTPLTSDDAIDFLACAEGDGPPDASARWARIAKLMERAVRSAEAGRWHVAKQDARSAWIHFAFAHPLTQAASGNPLWALADAAVSAIATMAPGSVALSNRFALECRALALKHGVAEGWISRATTAEIIQLEGSLSCQC